MDGKLGLVPWVSVVNVEVNADVDVDVDYLGCGRKWWHAMQEGIWNRHHHHHHRRRRRRRHRHRRRRRRDDRIAVPQQSPSGEGKTEAGYSSIK